MSSRRAVMIRLADVKTEIMFVTLDKSHRRFSATMRYEDYAISLHQIAPWPTPCWSATSR